MRRAYSVLEIKAFDENTRILRGMATTPVADRMGDIVEPMGAVFSLPMPLMYQHDEERPIGWVQEAKVTKEGIPIVAEVAEGVLPFIEEAWALIKAKLVRGLSLGFNPLETARIKDTYSFHFLKWEWLELSAVTIPANAEATITAVKRFDSAALAALGHRRKGIPLISANLPGVSGSSRALSHGAVKLITRE